MVSDIGKIVGGGTPSTKNPKFWNGNINWFSPNEINIKRYVTESNKKITKEGLKKSSAKILPAKNTILFTSRATIGEMALLTIDSATNQGFQSFVLNNNVSRYFIFSLQNKIKKIALKKASGSTFLEISKKEVEKIKINIPSFKEQKKIANLFKLIDDYLALYERKSKLLSQMKKYFLDNLFTENKYPNLRFKSYKDPWINKKISDFLSIPLKEKVSVNETSKILTVQLNLRGVTSGAVRSSLKLGATNYYKRKAGQLIYGKQNLFNGALAIIPEKYNNFVTSGDVPSLDINNISSDFIYYLFSRDNFYKKTEIYATGTGSKRIHEDVLLKIKIYVPQNINEQKQISNIIKTFIKIDSKYEKKLHLLRKIKQKLLDTMFI